MARFDVVVAGGGPAGMAAAVTAAESGAQVCVVDENREPGGQIWRGDVAIPRDPQAGVWRRRLEAAGVTWRASTQIVGAEASRGLDVVSPPGADRIMYDQLIVAAGARERFLPFPGWTLPNVTGAGGLQALVKSGFPLADRRVVVAGTGPLLWAAAAGLVRAGARVTHAVEQASAARLMNFGWRLAGHPATAAKAVGLVRRLRSMRLETGSWPVRAEGTERVEAITLSIRGRLQTVPCDYLAVGFHLVPNVELAMLLGCRLEDGAIGVDDMQATSVENVYAAGEATGIGGLQLALAEGQIAGFAAAGHPSQARKYFGLRKRGRRFARLVARTFALRPELLSLPTAETIVCRCEDVTLGQLAERTSWRDAKLQTRCGMGPCQGLVCGPALQTLKGWTTASVRPPLRPATVEQLMQLYAAENET